MAIAAGAYPSPLNYGKFPKSVCTSVNECLCHGIPDGRCACAAARRGGHSRTNPQGARAHGGEAAPPAPPTPPACAAPPWL
jgi:hypothetical protein